MQPALFKQHFLLPLLAALQPTSTPAPPFYAASDFISIISAVTVAGSAQGGNCCLALPHGPCLDRASLTSNGRLNLGLVDDGGSD